MKELHFTLRIIAPNDLPSNLLQQGLMEVVDVLAKNFKIDVYVAEALLPTHTNDEVAH